MSTKYCILYLDDESLEIIKIEDIKDKLQKTPKLTF